MAPSILSIDAIAESILEALDWPQNIEGVYWF